MTESTKTDGIEFGAITNASTQEPNYLKQYAYYAAGNSKVKFRHDNTTTSAGWWERSPYSGNPEVFCYVNTKGNASYRYANTPYGVSPCFKV